MRVLIIGASNIGWGGRSTAAYNLVRPICKDDCVFDFFCEGPGNIKERIEDEIIEKGGYIFKEDFFELNYVLRQKKWYLRLKRVLLLNDYCLVHVHVDNALEAFRAIFVIRFFSKVPIIVHGHTSRYMADVSKMRRVLANGLRHIVYKKAAACLACSENAWKHVFGKTLIDAEKKYIIKNGIEVEHFKFDAEKRQALRKALGFEKKVVIGHVGNFYFPKNHRRLLHIFDEFLKINKNAILLLIGDGELRSDLLKQVNDMGITDFVHSVGEVEDTSDYYNIMDAFVMPSLFEGIPLAGIEAQCSGVPCFFSNTITSEIKMTDRSHFISLDKSDREWAKIITDRLKCDDDDRYLTYIKIKEKGFDLEEASGQVMCVYKNVMGSKMG